MSITAQDLLHADARSYAKYVLKNRAFSEICDGLKPAQRALLWAAYKIGANKNVYFRALKIVSAAIGDYHPHGDQGVYDVLCNMTKNFTRQPYWEGESAFGDRFTSAASPRYTELKTSIYGNLFLREDYLKCVPYVASYTGTEKQPIYLPSLVPNILINGTRGIGYGASSLIPPFTIESIRPIIKNALLGKKYDVTKLEFNLMFDPICELKDLDYFKTGNGSLRLSPRRNITPDNSRYVLTHVYELPAKLDEILSLDPNVSSFYNMSKSSHVLNIEIKITGKPSERKACIARLDKLFTSSLRLISAWLEAPEGNDHYEDDIDYEIQFVRNNVSEIIEMWCAYRKDLERIRLTMLIKELKKKISYQRALLLAASHIDGITDIIKQALEREQIAQKIATLLNIDYENAFEVSGMALYKLGKLESKKVKDYLNKLVDEINELRDNLNNLEKYTAGLVDEALKSLLTRPVVLD